MYLGCDMNGKDENIVDWTKEDNGKSTKKVIKRSKSRNFVSNDALFCKFNEFDAIGANKVIKNDKEALNTMDLIVETTMVMLSNMMPVSDDMLILCFDYCKMFNPSLGTKLTDVINNVTKQCIDTRQKSDTKARDHEWYVK